ncbi:MAG: hypothetical protein LBD22_07630 [Spirochaetaceae bacterium]|jgi:hypothetical protein|nr:hypothetical protein [Spirochaetaceae bacterium]
MKQERIFTIVVTLLVLTGLAGCSATGFSDGQDTNSEKFNVAIKTELPEDEELITVNPELAHPGAEVKITVNQNNSHWLDNLEIREGVHVFTPQLAPNEQQSNSLTYLFNMPAADVTVTASFKDQKNSDATLRELFSIQGNIVQLSNDTLGFDQTVENYYLEIPSPVATADLSWTPSHITARTELICLTDLADLPRETPVNAKIRVAAQNGDLKNYTVKILRRPNLKLKQVEFLGPQGSEFSSTVRIMDPGPVIEPAIPCFSGSTVSLKLVPFDMQAKITGEGSYSTVFYNNIGVQNNCGLYITAGATLSGVVTVSKIVQSVRFTETYQLTVFRPADANYPQFPLAIGGTLQFIGGNGIYDEVHIFDSSANQVTFDVRYMLEEGSVSVFMVGGGGGGGKSAAGNLPGSGGGAGGVLHMTGLSLSTGDYTINVGSGGAGGAVFGINGLTKKQAAETYNGGNTTLTGGTVNLVAKGGGGGGWHQSGNGGAGGDGGSGGGGYGRSADAALGYENQGKNGGLHDNYGCAGGGGYKETGRGGTATNGAGHGGAGFSAAEIPMLEGVAMIPQEFAGGGAGGADNARATHGGGARFTGTDEALPRTATGSSGTGGGGAGGFNSNGFSGGSGIIIVRFKYTAPTR